MKQASISLNLFPNNDWIMDIALESRVFVIEFRSKEGYGVSELNKKEDIWISGHNDIFPDFLSAIFFVCKELYP